jgi:multiple sugar transport system ATP-binding protein
MKIEYQNVTKKFGDVVALSDFSLDVVDGEFVVMLGPSGCGKTTALRCLAGLETPTTGLLRIGDRIVNRLEPRDRDIALVFQSYALYPHMSVARNISYPLRIRKVSKPERLRRAQEVADKLQIGHLMGRMPKALSGGERQRVALARAIIRNPAAFLMDEPLSNLDAKLRVHMRAELKHLQQTLGVTTLYVTHDQAEALTMADRIAILNKGVLQQVGSGDEVYFRPANLFVAGFVGSPAMNLIPVAFKPDACRFEWGDGLALDAQPLLERYFLDAANPADYVLGIRPENVSLSLSPVPQAFAGTVYAVEPMGNEALVAVDINGTRLMVRTEASFRAAIRTPCWATLDLRALHLFDQASGVRLAER